MPRQAPGRVRDALLYVMEAHGGEATVRQLQEGVDDYLAASVSPSSVRSFLLNNEGTLFHRTARGRYASRPDSDGISGCAETIEQAFAFGRSLLYQGDCVAWLRDRERNSIQAVVTDPPYGLVEYSEAEQKKLRAGRGGVWRIPPSFDGHKRSPLPRFTTLRPDELSDIEDFFWRWAKALEPVLVPGAHVVVASNPLLSFLVSGALASAGLERRGEIVRLVQTMRGGDRPKNAHDEFPDVSVMARSMWEPWLVFRKPLAGRVQDNLRIWKTGGFRRISDEQPFGDVIASAPTRPQERKLAPHPSLKPQAFLRQVVRAVLPLGEGVVLDPFAGAGSTLAAAEAVGYASIGVESDAVYVDVARSAIPQLAVLPA